jgi:hypothetical protein
MQHESVKRTSRRGRKLAGDTLPRSPILGTELLRRSFVPFLDEIDARVGRDARVALGRGYSWLSAWSEGLLPTQAIAEACEWYLVGGGGIRR